MEAADGTHLVVPLVINLDGLGELGCIDIAWDIANFVRSRKASAPPRSPAGLPSRSNEAAQAPAEGSVAAEC